MQDLDDSEPARQLARAAARGKLGGKERAESAKLRPSLSAERIVATALALVEEHGLPAFTIRRLGEALGCEAMSVYHYFPSKRHLLDALVEHVARRASASLRPISIRSTGCASSAGNTGRWRIAIRSSFLLPPCTGSTCPPASAFIERILRHFHAALPDDQLAAQAFRIFGYYVIGAALDETAGYAAGSVGGRTR